MIDRRTANISSQVPVNCPPNKNAPVPSMSRAQKVEGADSIFKNPELKVTDRDARAPQGESKKSIPPVHNTPPPQLPRAPLDLDRQCRNDGGNKKNSVPNSAPNSAPLEEKKKPSAAVNSYPPNGYSPGDFLPDLKRIDQITRTCAIEYVRLEAPIKPATARALHFLRANLHSFKGSESPILLYADINCIEKILEDKKTPDDVRPELSGNLKQLNKLKEMAPPLKAEMVSSGIFSVASKLFSICETLSSRDNKLAVAWNQVRQPIGNLKCGHIQGEQVAAIQNAVSSMVAACPDLNKEVAFTQRDPRINLNYYSVLLDAYFARAKQNSPSLATSVPGGPALPAYE